MDEALTRFNAKLLEVTNYDEVFFNEYMKSLEDKAKNSRFSFRFNQYLKILERDIDSEETEKETLDKVNNMMSKDKVIQETFGDNVSLYFDDSIESENSEQSTNSTNRIYNYDYKYNYEGAALDAPFCLYI